MKVLLVDADSTIPNVALMKLSAYHKSQGDEVTLKEFRKITLTGAMEEGSVSYDNGPPMKTSRGLWLEIFVCPRCGTLKI